MILVCSLGGCNKMKQGRNNQRISRRIIVYSCMLRVNNVRL